MAEKYQDRVRNLQITIPIILWRILPAPAVSISSFSILFPPHVHHNYPGTLTTEPQNMATNGQAQLQQTPTSAQPLSVAASAVPAALLRPKVDDREQVSLNTTLTANNRRVPFYRRKASNRSSASDVALSPSTSPSLIKSRRESSRSRPSFLSRVVHRVVPCVSPDPDVVHNTHDDDASEPRRSLALQEMSSVRPVGHAMDLSAPGSSLRNQGTIATDAQDALASPSLTFPPVTIQIQPPPSPTDSEVIVPPPPSAHLLPEDETDGVTSGAVQPPGSTGDQLLRSSSHESEDSDGTNYTDDEAEDRHMLDEQDEEERLIRNGGSGIPIGSVRPLKPFLCPIFLLSCGYIPQDGIPKPLLPPASPEHAGRKCLVLDLDETLVHSSFKVRSKTKLCMDFVVEIFKAIQQADFIVPVEIEYHWHHFHVLKRPGVDNFLKKMGEIYEIVIFTASLSKVEMLLLVIVPC